MQQGCETRPSAARERTKKRLLTIMFRLRVAPETLEGYDLEE
jgi:hypothetical protein